MSISVANSILQRRTELGPSLVVERGEVDICAAAVRFFFRHSCTCIHVARRAVDHFPSSSSIWVQQPSAQ